MDNQKLIELLNEGSEIMNEYAKQNAKLKASLAFIVEQVDNPKNGEYSLKAFRLGIGMDTARKVLGECK